MLMQLKSYSQSLVLNQNTVQYLTVPVFCKNLTSKPTYKLWLFPLTVQGALGSNQEEDGIGSVPSLSLPRA